MNTPKTDAAAQFISHFGWQVHADFSRQLETQVQELRDCLSIWSGDGHLQTFEDRERFRKQARAVLERTK